MIIEKGRNSVSFKREPLSNLINYGEVYSNVYLKCIERFVNLTAFDCKISDLRIE